MGKPFKLELDRLGDTYAYARCVPLEGITSAVERMISLPLVAVGSGGSLTVARLASKLHETFGSLAQAMTPLEFVSSPVALRDTSVIIITAGGRNSDILTAFRRAAVSEPLELLALSAQPNSPLANLAEQHAYARFFALEPPSGKDGFLATNSLIAFITFLIRAYGTVLQQQDDLPPDLDSLSSTRFELGELTYPLLNRGTWVILHGRWGTAAAWDLESKLTEAALNHAQVADYRNFGHGRHHWLAKRSDESGVIALIGPDDRHIADRTLNVLPRHIPVLRVETERGGPAGALDLLVRSLHLVAHLGSARGIDPGRPGVPPFGHRIYHLGFSVPTNLRDGTQLRTAIARKTGHSVARIKSLAGDRYWEKAHRVFVDQLKRTSFGSVVFDYDGTLCDSSERYSVPSEPVSKELLRLLSHGVVIGVATGRGKSVRHALRQVIPQAYWGCLWIGYYNGGDVGELGDDDCPDTETVIEPGLESIRKSLEDSPLVHNASRIQCRPKQISVEPTVHWAWQQVKDAIHELVRKNGEPGVRVVESRHSLDIIAPGVTKLRLVQVCSSIAAKRGNPPTVLCIGDQGKWPGNDYDILSTPFSLSVDSVSPDVKTCWNLSSPGTKSVQATLEYMQKGEAAQGQFRFKG